MKREEPVFLEGGENLEWSRSERHQARNSKRQLHGKAQRQTALLCVLWRSRGDTESPEKLERL